MSSLFYDYDSGPASYEAPAGVLDVYKRQGQYGRVDDAVKIIDPRQA